MTRILLAAFLGVTSFAISAESCECVKAGSPCEATTMADVVFVGRVTSLSGKGQPADSGPTGRTAEFQSLEGFRGFENPAGAVLVDAGPGDCGYAFEIGQVYVVYAHYGPAGSLTTSACTRTRRIADATEDLTYLRRLKALPLTTPGRLAGRVQLWEGPERRTPPVGPMPGVAVTATGDGRTFSSTTDTRGEFVITDLPRGTYDITVDAPDGYESHGVTAHLFDPRSCGPIALYVNYDGGVRGRVVDRTGAPVGGLPIQLAPRADVDARGGGRERYMAWTAPDGRFEVHSVPPGEYVLGTSSIVGADGQLTFPRAFHPGVTDVREAQKIVIGAAQRLEMPDFVIPASIRFVTVSGIVVDEDGRPVDRAQVILRDDTEGPNWIGPRFYTGADGRFSFSLADGVRYDVFAERYVDVEGAPQKRLWGVMPFKASTTTPAITVVVTDKHR